MKVAVAGYGIEGEQNYRYWSEQGHQVTILDERDVPERPVPVGATVRTGATAFSDLDAFDLVVRTAGLSPHKLKAPPQKVWSATNEFFAQCQAPIIGVTGSKGKGTTCSLITSVLRAADYTVHLVGNIGTPALEVLPSIEKDHVVVYELSSFQLWDLERSPHQAVVLHIEPDHLDVHTDFDEYIAAKSRIVVTQSLADTCVYHPTNRWSRQIAEQQPYFATRAVPYAAAVAPHTIPSVHVESDNFVSHEGQVLAPVSALRLPGAHNVENACAALSVCLDYDVTPAQCEKGLASFRGLPHRLRFVREKDGVTYYDDSIATTPGSAIAAIAAFDAPKVLILGGSHKGADFSELAQKIHHGSVRTTLVVGEEAGRIAAALDEAGVDAYDVVHGSMSEIVARAAAVARQGDVVVLSPACASFGMFRNYQDRGEQFIAAVEAL